MFFNKFVFSRPNYVLNESQKKWIKETETKIYDLLKETPPNGKHFAKYIGVSKMKYMHLRLHIQLYINAVF